MPAAPVDPLRRAKALAEAAELKVALSSPELAEVLGMSPATVSSWLDGHSPRPGFSLHRQKIGNAVWWTVERQNDTVSNVHSFASSRPNSLGGRSVGFSSYLTVEAVALPYF
jgi:predicted transcriptional regulator